MAVYADDAQDVIHIHIKHHVPANRSPLRSRGQARFIRPNFMAPISTIIGAISDWASQYFVWMLVSSAFMFVGSLLVAWLMILRIPADYLCRPDTINCRKTQQTTLAYFFRKLVWNSLGFALLMTGFLMLFTPGQGLLFILLGVTLMDLPYKNQITQRLASRKGTLGVINGIRSRSGKQALTTESQT